MLIFTFGAVSLAVFAFARAWWTDSGNRFVFTPFLLFSITELVMNWPAGLRAAFESPSRYYPLLLMVFGYSVFAAAFLLGARAFRHNAAVLRKFLSAAPALKSPPRATLTVLSLLCVILSGVGLILYRGVPPVITAMGDLVAGEYRGYVAEGVSESRRAITKGHYFGEAYRGQGALRTVISVGWPYLAGVAVSLMLWRRRREGTRQSAKWMALFFVVQLMLMFAFVAGDGTRGPFLWALVYLFVMISYTTMITVRHVALSVSVAVAIMVGMSVLSHKLNEAFESSSFLLDATVAIVERITVGNGQNTVFTINLVNSGVWNLRLGEAHLQKLVAALPGVTGDQPLSHERYQILNPSGSGTTFASATYLADLYLDWGIVGVALGYALMGLVIAWVQAKLFQPCKSIFDFSLVVAFGAYAGRMSLTGPTAVLVSLGIVLLLDRIVRAGVGLLQVGEVPSGSTTHRLRPVRTRTRPWRSSASGSIGARTGSMAASGMDMRID